MSDGVVVVRGHFAPGEKVKLVSAAGGGAAPAHVAGLAGVDEQAADKSGVVIFEGLQLGARFWAVGEEGRASTVTAKDVGDARTIERSQRLSQPGGTRPSVPQDERFLQDRPKGGAVGPRQQDVPLDVVQRSDTPIGAATPIPAGERSPQPAVQDADGLKASDTDEGELVPSTRVGRQDEVPDRVLQRSSTERGVATVIPDDVEPLRVGDEYADPGDVHVSDFEVPVSQIEEHPVDEGATSGVEADTGKEGGQRVGQTEKDVKEANAEQQKMLRTVGILPGSDVVPDAEVVDDEAVESDEAPKPESAADLKDRISRMRSTDKLEQLIEDERDGADRVTVIEAAQARICELNASE